VNPEEVFGQSRPQLSHSVLIALLQQISVSLAGSADTLRKLDWISFILPDLDPTDATIAEYVEPVLKELILRLGQVEPLYSRQSKVCEHGVRRALALATKH